MSDVWDRAFRRSLARGDDPTYALFLADEALKRATPTLHWHLPETPAYVTACGRYMAQELLTDDKAAVTCGRCQRSVMFTRAA